MFTLNIIFFEWNEYSVDLSPLDMPHDTGELKTYMSCKKTDLVQKTRLAVYV